jgi:hypothetical protein
MFQILSFDHFSGKEMVMMRIMMERMRTSTMISPLELRVVRLVWMLTLLLLLIMVENLCQHRVFLRWS